MCTLGPSGLAVIDDDGKLMDVVSARDIRAILSRYELMWKPIRDLKAAIRAEHPDTPSSPVTVGPTATLAQVLFFRLELTLVAR